MFVTFGRRGGGHFIVRIDCIIAITDRTDGCELSWLAGDQVLHVQLGYTAEDALGLIEFEQEKNRRAVLIDGGRAVKP